MAIDNKKEPETRKFIKNAFRNGEIKTAGTYIDRLVPPVSRFGSGNRAVKKQGVIDKLTVFFEKFFGVGGSFATEESDIVYYEDVTASSAALLAAEDPVPYDQGITVSKFRNIKQKDNPI